MDVTAILAGLRDALVTAWQLSLEEEDPLLEAESQQPRSPCRASIDVRGSWSGSIGLSCELGVARRLASSYFGREADECTEQDIRDAVGEFLNVIAGNVKSLLGSPCDLGLPRIGDATEDGQGGDPVGAVTMTWKGLPLRAEILPTA